MPVISRFYGIVITRYFKDHNPPHCHAEYGGHEAIIDLMETFWRVTYPAEHLGLYKNGLRRTIWN